MAFFTTAAGKPLRKISEKDLEASKKLFFTQSQFGDDETQKNVEDVDEQKETLNENEGKDHFAELSEISKGHEESKIEIEMNHNGEGIDHTTFPQTQMSQDTLTTIIQEMNDSENMKETKTVLKPSKRQSLLHQQPLKYPTPLKRKPLTPSHDGKKKNGVRLSITKTLSTGQKPVPTSPLDQVSFVSKTLDAFDFCYDGDAVCPLPTFDKALETPIINNTNCGRKSEVLSLAEWSKFIPNVTNMKWLENQLRHVIWKHLGYYFHNRTILNEVTVKDVIEEVEKRRVFELRPKRSFYRLLYNKDENYGLCHVCVVASIIKGKNTRELNRLVVSDGWYTITLIVDGDLSQLISMNKIYVGQKLRVCGMECVGSENAREPWEGDTLEMRVSVNCVRRAERIEKLGRTKCIAFLVTVNSIREGIVPAIRVCVERIYPTRYKFSDTKLMSESEFSIEENKRKVLLEKEFSEYRKEVGDNVELLESFKQEKMKELVPSGLKVIRVLDGMQRNGKAKRMNLNVWVSRGEEVEFKERKWVDVYWLKAKIFGGVCSLEALRTTHFNFLNDNIELPKEYEERTITEILDISLSTTTSVAEVDVVFCVLKVEDDSVYITDASMKTCLVKRNFKGNKKIEEFRVFCCRNLGIASVYNNDVVLKETEKTEWLSEGKREDEKVSIKKLRQMVESFHRQFESMQRGVMRIVNDEIEETVPRVLELLKKLSDKEEEIKLLKDQLKSVGAPN
ncbi:hypothetical protein EIN_057070 [Entamoeba invadens IP1]|uniref:hypothetical protein n=1 Tax=Entamoeba invadens IP1 TaxID=370355 RepID=UPI0002C3EA33|nr:hypothetical protein EIN_057070 [Entamoeba invadens IP1]ELP93322.1 hypothetical protein EIN_057070 [Entamoeba invadens IP1]|eukprot:XP_004260093.1 hypothetical protein EIN_057070 [Entamoeba invadens IP1]